MTKWLSGRKVLTVIVLTLLTVEIERHNITSGDYLMGLLGCLAGHHLPEILAKWRGGRDVSGPNGS